MKHDWMDLLKDFAGSSSSQEQGPALPHPPPPQGEPRRIGKYEIVREAARGGMGIVYEAFDPDLRRKVAIKVLNDESESAETIERLYREASAAAGLRHPNIVAVHEVGREERSPSRSLHYIVMDYIEGKSLAEEETTIGRRERLGILDTVARAVGYAHSQGVIHRDIKPQNIILERRASDASGAQAWRPVLTDFGLAKLQGTDALTRPGAVIGTAHYMAPEQVLGHADKAAPQTDVWALGVILYEMITDQKPFVGESAFDIHRKIADADPPAPRAINRAIHPDVETVCLKAMEKEIGKRYPDATAFADDLRRYLSDEPILARPVGGWAKLARLTRRHPVTAAVLSAAMATVAAAAIFAAFQYFNAIDERIRAESARAESDRRLADLLEEKREKEQRRKTEDALRPATVLLDRWELSGKAFSPEDDKYVADAIDAAGRLYPGSGPWQLETGRRQWARGQLDEAETSFTKACGDPAVRFLAFYYRARVRLAIYAGNRPAPEITIASGEGDATVRYDLSRPEATRDRRLRVAAIADLEEFQRYSANDPSDRRMLFGKGLALKYSATKREEYLAAANILQSVAGSGLVGGWIAFFEAGEACALGEEFERSVLLFKKSIEAGRNDFTAWHSLGLYLKMAASQKLLRGEEPRADLNEAFRALTKAVEIDSSSAGAWNNRSTVSLTVARIKIIHGEDPIESFDAAIADLTKAVTILQTHAGAWSNRGLAFWHRGKYLAAKQRDPTRDFQDAIDDFSRAVALDPSSPAIWTNKGGITATIAKYGMERGDDPTKDLLAAAEDCRTAIALDPQYAMPWLNRGNIHLNLAKYKLSKGEYSENDFTEAIRCSNRAIAIDKRSYVARNNRGCVYFIMAREKRSKGVDCTEDIRKAEEDFTGAIALHKSYIESYVNRALLYMLAERWKDALKDFDLAVSLNPIVGKQHRTNIDICRQKTIAPR